MQTIPFTLSALMHLKRLSISTLVFSNATKQKWALPDIIRLVNTAPFIPDVILQFHCVSDSVISLARLDWSLLDHLKSDFTGKRPRIDLCVTGKDLLGAPFCPESILDALAKNEALMDLMKRGQVILTANHCVVSEWDEIIEYYLLYDLD